MMKRLTVILLIALLALSSFAFAAEQRVYDDANLLSSDEIAALEERVAALRTSTGMDIALHTADSGVGDTTAYADAFYENMGFGAGSNRKGVLFFIDMENRTTYISTAGDMIDIIDDAREEEIFDAQMSYLSNGDFAGAFTAALDLTEQYCDAGVAEGHYAYDETTGETLQPATYGSNYYRDLRISRALTGGGVGLVLGLIAGFITKASIKKSYAKRYKPVPYDPDTKAALQLTVNDSKLINKVVTTRVIPRNNDNDSSGGARFGGGSGSGVHMSSGGMSHGGGGRGF